MPRQRELLPSQLYRLQPSQPEVLLPWRGPQTAKTWCGTPPQESWPQWRRPSGCAGCCRMQPSPATRAGPLSEVAPGRWHREGHAPGPPRRLALGRRRSKTQLCRPPVPKPSAAQQHSGQLSHSSPAPQHLRSRRPRPPWTCVRATRRPCHPVRLSLPTSKTTEASTSACRVRFRRNGDSQAGGASSTSNKRARPWQTRSFASSSAGAPGTPPRPSESLEGRPCRYLSLHP
mmetsp:Transcript_6777/g.16860  ORF Transcript_6777/g.16860 Transcript_6777/m.16860 type:complete len:231 (-) Transcript_6777:58-750(-)